MKYPSQSRKESMAMTFLELDKVTVPIIICEVGRLRNQYAGESDGHSTLMFAAYVNEHSGSKFLSIDVDQITEDVCVKQMENACIDSANTTFVNTDAIRFFLDWPPEKVIDLLYLDGWDLVDKTSAKRHLICFMLAEPFIKDGGLVLIDDTNCPELGKGELIARTAMQMGWTILFRGTQTLIRKP